MRNWLTDEILLVEHPSILQESDGRKYLNPFPETEVRFAPDDSALAYLHDSNVTSIYLSIPRWKDDLVDTFIVNLPADRKITEFALGSLEDGLPLALAQEPGGIELSYHPHLLTRSDDQFDESGASETAEMPRLLYSPGGIESLAFTGNGSYLFAKTARAVYYWDLSALRGLETRLEIESEDRLRARLCSRMNRSFTAEEWATFVGKGEPRNHCGIGSDTGDEQ